MCETKDLVREIYEVRGAERCQDQLGSACKTFSLDTFQIIFLQYHGHSSNCIVGMHLMSRVSTNNHLLASTLEEPFFIIYVGREMVNPRWEQIEENRN